MEIGGAVRGARWAGMTREGKESRGGESRFSANASRVFVKAKIYLERVMSQVRPVYRGATLLLTRRCEGRRMWLLPRAWLVALFGYVVAVMAKRYGMLVHQAVVMGNHWHVVLTDVEGVAPDFARDVHRLISRRLNAYRGRRGSLWDQQRVSLVRMCEPEKILDRMVYSEVNPVAAGLVASPRAWPGLRITPRSALEGPLVFERPERLFGEDSDLPKRVELEVHVPPGFEAEGPEAFVERFEGCVRERVRQLRAKRRSFVGAPAVVAQPLGAQPEAEEVEEPLRARRRPLVACADPEVRRAMLKEIATFRREYAKARRAWLGSKSGDPPVEFPVGTFKMRRYPGVSVRERPPDQSRATA